MPSSLTLRRDVEVRVHARPVQREELRFWLEACQTPKSRTRTGQHVSYLWLRRPSNSTSSLIREHPALQLKPKQARFRFTVFIVPSIAFIKRGLTPEAMLGREAGEDCQP